MLVVSWCMWHCGYTSVNLINGDTRVSIFMYNPPTVEVEVYEPVQKKPQIDTDTESDGVCSISNLLVSYYCDGI